MKSFLATLWYIIMQEKAAQILKILFGLYYVKIS